MQSFQVKMLNAPTQLTRSAGMDSTTATVSGLKQAILRDHTLYGITSDFPLKDIQVVFKGKPLLDTDHLPDANDRSAINVIFPKKIEEKYKLAPSAKVDSKADIKESLSKASKEERDNALTIYLSSPSVDPDRPFDNYSRSKGYNEEILYGTEAENVSLAGKNLQDFYDLKPDLIHFIHTLSASVSKDLEKVLEDKSVVRNINDMAWKKMRVKQDERQSLLDEKEKLSKNTTEENNIKISEIEIKLKKIDNPDAYFKELKEELINKIKSDYVYHAVGKQFKNGLLKGYSDKDSAAAEVQYITRSVINLHFNNPPSNWKKALEDFAKKYLSKLTLSKDLDKINTELKSKYENVSLQEKITKYTYFHDRILTLLKTINTQYPDLDKNEDFRIWQHNIKIAALSNDPDEVLLKAINATSPAIKIKDESLEKKEEDPKIFLNTLFNKFAQVLNHALPEDKRVENVSASADCRVGNGLVETALRNVYLASVKEREILGLSRFLSSLDDPRKINHPEINKIIQVGEKKIDDAIPKDIQKTGNVIEINRNLLKILNTTARSVYTHGDNFAQQTKYKEFNSLCTITKAIVDIHEQYKETKSSNLNWIQKKLGVSPEISKDKLVIIESIESELNALLKEYPKKPVAAICSELSKFIKTKNDGIKLGMLDRRSDLKEHIARVTTLINGVADEIKKNSQEAEKFQSSQTKTTQEKLAAEFESNPAHPSLKSLGPSPAKQANAAAAAVTASADRAETKKMAQEQEKAKDSKSPEPPEPTATPSPTHKS